MRGSPLLRALIAFLVLLGLGFPLWRLTRESVLPEPIAIVSKELPAKDIELHLNFTTLPSACRIRHLGKEVWGTTAPTAEMEARLRIPYPEKGVDLQFELTWPVDPLAALRVRLTDPEGETHERTVWGRGEVVEVRSFP